MKTGTVGFAILTSIVMFVGCAGSPGEKRLTTERVERGIADPEELVWCDVISDTFVSSSVTGETACKRWLGRTEAELCRATVYFNAATRLEPQSAVTWGARLAYFRRAVEHLSDVLFETRTLASWQFWEQPEREENLATDNGAQEGYCQFDSFIGNNPDNVDELLYFRQLKVQAVELYRRVAEYYTYALVASADASRKVSGNTAERSDRVWGPDVTDSSVGFLDLKGDRGAAAAFLLGTDVSVLDSLIKRIGDSSVTKVEDGCGTLPGEFEAYLEESICNARMITPLPGCRYAVRGAPLDRARQILQRYGVPLTGSGAHVTDGDGLGQLVMARMNQQRERDGLPPHTDLDALLVELQTDRSSLETASRYLAEEERLLLRNVRKVTDTTLPTGIQTYKDGLSGSGLPIQEIEVRGRVNGSRVGYEDLDLAAGDVPVYRNNVADAEINPAKKYNYFKHSYFKTLGLLRELLRYRVDDPSYLSSWADPTVVARKDEVDEPYRKILSLIEDEIGADEIRYDITLLSKTLSGGFPQPTDTDKLYTVQVRIPDVWQDVEVILGKPYPDPSPATALKDGRDGLRCRLFGEVGGAPCDVSQYRAGLTPVTCQPAQAGQVCYRLQVRTYSIGYDWQPPKESPIYVLSGGKVVDSVVFERGSVWSTWPPPVGLIVAPTTHSLRSQVGPRPSERLAKILDRSEEQCTEARYNALGLANSLVPPLENELIASSGGGGTGGNNLEDSYQFYLRKAQESSGYASTKIREALDVEGTQLRYDAAVAEARAQAANRIEQICGEGRGGCGVVKEPPLTLNALWFVPDMQANLDDNWQCDGYDENPYLENYLAMDEPPPIASPEDFIHVGRWLQCHNKQWFDTFAASYKIVDLPSVIKDDPYMREGRVYDYDGEYLAALLEISNGLIDFMKTMDSLFFLQDTIGLTMGALGAQVAAAKARVNAEQMAQIFAITRGIANLIGSIATQSFAGFVAGGFGMQADVTTAQMKEQIAQLELEATLKGNMVKAAEMVFNAQQLYDTMAKSINQVQIGIQNLKKLELQQTQATNDVERLEGAKLNEMLGTSCTGGEEGQCLKAYRTLFNVKHLQALDALRRAQKMSFIAKRALELKLGLDFTKEQNPGIIVDAPSRWQDDLFLTFSDEAIYNGDSNTTSSYVQKLEDYLFGYPFDHPFADEEDLAVLSMRDDLLAVEDQEPCLVEVPSTNYVQYSEELDKWQTYSSSGDVVVVKDAVEAPQSPFETSAERVVSEAGFQLVSPEAYYFGDRSVEGDPWQTWLQGAVWARTEQSSLIRTFVYATYYEKGTRKQTRRRTISSVAQSVYPALGWVRLTLAGSIDPPTEDEDVTLRMVVAPSSSGTFYLWGAQINAGTAILAYEKTPQHEVNPGCQLYEWQDPYSGALRSEYHPGPEMLASILRSRFRVKCRSAEALVQTNDLSICGNHEELEFFETTFSISMEEVQSGKYLRQDQIAVGNYNYRILQVAVNLVGSNVKDCTLDPGAGSACYQNLFIPYDLTHGGHVKVLDYEAKANPFTMSTGVIHYAKALAAERLLTNPLSSTDVNLIAPYEKAELRGRPLQGNYVLRIYNTPGLRWGNVEDVQILLKYRYWSAFSNP